MTFPGGTHDLWIRYWLAAGGIDPDKDIETIVVPPRADGGEHEGRHDGLLLRLRAVEPPAHPPEHRLHRDHHRRTLEQASGEVVRHARGLRRQISQGRQGAADGRHGSAAVVREGREQRRDRGDLRQAPVDQRARSRTSPTASRASSTTAFPARWSRSSPHIMRYWATTPPIRSRATTCGSSPKTSAGASSRASYDAKALIAKVNREDLWREAAKALACRRGNPGLEVARQGDLL